MRLLRTPRFWIAVAIVLVVLILLSGFVAYFFAPKILAAPQQPLEFSHKAMVKGANITCLYCHSDAMRGPSAGIPSVEKCVGCHRTAHIRDETDSKPSPAVLKALEYYDKGQPIPWVRVNELPRFVYFSHQAHIAAGFNCERCHGDVGNMTVDVPVVNMNMGWCLDCHSQQPNSQQLRDCMICHK